MTPLQIKAYRNTRSDYVRWTCTCGREHVLNQTDLAEHGYVVCCQCGSEIEIVGVINVVEIRHYDGDQTQVW